MMQVIEGDTLDPAVQADYMAQLWKHVPTIPGPVRIDSIAFYQRTRQAFGVVMTGETRTYGNLLLKKGVTRVE
jgi:L-fucose mutarotase